MLSGPAGKDAPRPFCTNHLLKEGEIYTWEFTNPIIGRHYLLKDRLIEWDGRNARMEIAFDTTESENEKILLKYTLNAEKMVMECVRTLYQEHDFDVAVDQVLGHLGKFLCADRSYIFNIRDHLLYNDYEWCAEHVAPQKEFLQAVPLSLIERWYPYFETQGCVEIEDIELIKESSPDEYHVLKEQDIRSLVVAPLEHGERWKAVSVSIILRRTRCRTSARCCRHCVIFCCLQSAVQRMKNSCRC